MSLRIIPASAPITVDTIVLTTYSPPGLGKTSLAFSADAPLLLDTDKGAHRSQFRKDAVRPESWNDISGITKADVQGYKTLVLDTAGRALDLLALDIMEKNPKLGRGGALTLQGYGELKSRFTAYLTLVRSFGLDVVLVAHSDEKQQGDETIERIDMQGASKNEVYKSSDAMARLAIVGGKRVLSFSPTDTRFGKDPAQLGSVPIPHLSEQPAFLGDVIRQIKAKLNAASAQQTEAATGATTFANALASADTPEAFTALIEQANGDKTRKRALHNAATTKGYKFDALVAAYVDPAKLAAVTEREAELPF